MENKNRLLLAHGQMPVRIKSCEFLMERRIRKWNAIRKKTLKNVIALTILVPGKGSAVSVSPIT
jgi:hypothetical protein